RPMSSAPPPNSKPPGPADSKPGAPRPRLGSPGLAFTLIALLAITFVYWISEVISRTTISYGYFLEQLQSGNIAQARINGLEVIGKFAVPPEIPAGERMPKSVQVVSYGLLLVELKAGNVDEA